MTHKQAHQLERAAAIAARDGLEVVGKGHTKDGRTVYAVPSRSQPERWHLVIVAGAQLVCDCEAARHGRICAHRAAVRERLRAEIADGIAQRDAERERAILARNTRPFSIWRAEQAPTR